MDNPWIPPTIKTSDGEQRRVGVEIELAAIPPQTMIDAITSHFSGKSHWHTAFEVDVSDTELGKFKIELDSRLLREIARDSGVIPDASAGDKSIEGLAIAVIESAASQFVPWEIVTSPINMTDLHKLVALINTLRERGAKGTHFAARYAFGVHLNPELPSFDAETILRYLRAFMLVHPHIIAVDNVALSRRITPHINHFSVGYQKHILAGDYTPSLDRLIDDYLVHNPTRNRSLDMLPLFQFLDQGRVKRVIKDDRIQSRPTFHYRLPDCDIDNPAWNIHIPWRTWLWVEHLAENEDVLIQLCQYFLEDISRLTYPLDSQWPERIKHALEHELGVADILSDIGEF